MLQLVPARQVINYFFIDNQLTEEIAEANKSATKNMRMLDEDKLMHEIDLSVSPALILNKDAFFHYSETIPVFYTAEILTPPPNKDSI